MLVDSNEASHTTGSCRIGFCFLKKSEDGWYHFKPFIKIKPVEALKKYFFVQDGVEIPSNYLIPGSYS